MNRIQGLESLQLTNVRKAQLIENNLQMADAAILIIRNAIATGMDWRELEDLVKDEQKRGNPIALMIDSLKLETNQVSLRLRYVRKKRLVVENCHTFSNQFIL
jgi:hypothetical protein